MQPSSSWVVILKLPFPIFIELFLYNKLGLASLVILKGVGIISFFLFTSSLEYTLHSRQESKHYILNTACFPVFGKCHAQIETNRKTAYSENFIERKLFWSYITSGPQLNPVETSGIYFQLKVYTLWI